MSGAEEVQVEAEEVQVESGMQHMLLRESPVHGVGYEGNLWTVVIKPALEKCE